jgi:hypothetical protein
LGQHIENELTRKIKDLPYVVKKETNFDVAHIAFAYANKDLLNLLLERGSLITKGKLGKPLEKINTKIDKLIQNEGEKMERPVAAFITFET